MCDIARALSLHSDENHCQIMMLGVGGMQWPSMVAIMYNCANIKCVASGSVPVNV